MKPDRRPVLVCISGGDGSGKSTQVEAVRHILATRGVQVATASIWDAMHDPQIAPNLGFSHREAVHNYLGVLGPAARAHFLFHALHVAMDCAFNQSPDLILINAYWYKYYATEVAYGGDPSILRCQTAGFTSPQLTCYLRSSAESAMKRKLEPSDYESGYGDGSTFMRLQEASRVVLDGLADELKWTTLDGEESRSVVTASIVQAIDDLDVALTEVECGATES